jgi:hypothetical protein
MMITRGFTGDHHKDQWESSQGSLITTGINGDHHRDQWSAPQSSMRIITRINGEITGLTKDQKMIM